MFMKLLASLCFLASLGVSLHLHTQSYAYYKELHMRKPPKQNTS